MKDMKKPTGMDLRLRFGEWNLNRKPLTPSVFVKAVRIRVKASSDGGRAFLEELLHFVHFFKRQVVHEDPVLGSLDSIAAVVNDPCKQLLVDFYMDVQMKSPEKVNFKSLRLFWISDLLRPFLIRRPDFAQLRCIHQSSHFIMFEPEMAVRYYLNKLNSKAVFLYQARKYAQEVDGRIMFLALRRPPSPTDKHFESFLYEDYLRRKAEVKAVMPLLAPVMRNHRFDRVSPPTKRKKGVPLRLQPSARTPLRITPQRDPFQRDPLNPIFRSIILNLLGRRVAQPDDYYAFFSL